MNLYCLGHGKHSLGFHIYPLNVINNNFYNSKRHHTNRNQYFELLVDGDDALTEAVVYFQPGVRLRHKEDRLIITGFRRPLPGPRRPAPP